MCGWETGDITELGTTTIGSSSTLAVATGTPTPASGGYCLKAASTGVISSLLTFLRATYGSALTEVWHRFKVYPHSAGGVNPIVIFRALDSANGVQLTITWDPSDNLIRVYRGAPTSNLLGVTSVAVTADAWNLIDFHYIISATVGVIEVWIAGTQRLNLTGQNTKSTTNTNVQGYDVGLMMVAGATPANGEYIAFDDLAANTTAGSLNNGRIGAGSVFLLSPNGAGSNTNQSIGGSVPAGTNYQSVNEVPPDSGVTFVYSASTGVRDTYALADLPAGASVVNAVEVIAQCEKSDAGAGSIGLTVKSSSTTNEASAQGLSTTWSYYRALYETDPATAAQWLVAAVNAMEAGTTTE